MKLQSRHDRKVAREEKRGKKEKGESFGDEEAEGAEEEIDEEKNRE